MSLALKHVVRAALVAAALIVALGVGRPATAAAAPSCWKVLINDWYKDGRVDKVYPKHCYRDAIRHLPEDVTQYSSARDDIERALQTAITGKPGPSGGTTGTSGGGGGTSGGTDTTTAGPDTGSSGSSNGDESPFANAVDKITPGNADSLPLPLLILGALALLLIGGGAAGVIVRRMQDRGAPPDAL